VAAVLGGGPAGLMAAEILSQAGVRAHLFDAMPSVGRKFLMAGKGGMNITHSEPFDLFLSRYGPRRAHVEPLLHGFTPEMLREWAQGLGIGTFVGSSGRVFPDDMKAAPLLRAWLHQLRGAGVCFHMRHNWLGWDGDENDGLRFDTPDGIQTIKPDAVVLALGGGSWKQLGSTAAWVPLLRQRGVAVAPLQPSNCGFDVGWSGYFQQHFAGHPVKSVQLAFSPLDGNTIAQRGELMVTTTGLEGGLIYTFSALLRDTIAEQGPVHILLDLLPDKDLAFLIQRLSQARGKHSLANFLRKQIGIDGVKAGLLREIAHADDFFKPVQLAHLIKALPIKLLSPRPLDEAISSAGGVTFDALDEHLMCRAIPGVFCGGEMLDWEAPTGGYLLTACLASGRAAGLGALAWLRSRHDFRPL